MHAHIRFPASPRRIHRSLRHLCVGMALLTAAAGCVSHSTYEAATKEMTALRAELLTAQGELQALESQQDALKKLNMEGQRILTGIRAELQHARAAYAELQTEQTRLEALKAKAQALQTEHAKHMREIKAAKRAELKMQAVIDRYEREMGELSEIGDMLRISKEHGSDGASAPLVATVTPLPSEPTPVPAAQITSVPNASPAPPMVKEPTNAQAPTAPAVASVPPASAPQPAAVHAPPASPSAAPPPAARPASPNDTWLVGFTDWLWSLWGWLFS